MLAAYRMAFLDWLACACAGAGERAAVAARAGGSDVVADVAFAGTAGHVLDFDDTLSDGVAHVSAATAPAALVLAAHLGRPLADALTAYADGYEAMGAVASAAHPALYDGGWHPTAVCGPIGAAVAAARLLRLSDGQREMAVTIALLRAGGARGAFGSDGKALQVGLAASAGVQAALIAGAGADVDPRAVHGPVGVMAVTGARWPLGSSGEPVAVAELIRPAGRAAIERNWIKLHPSCLGTHSPIEGAERLGEMDAGEPLEVAVHTVARQAAHLDAVSDGLSAKFSIPYCVAHTLTRGAPGRGDFAAVDTAVAERARSVAVVVDDALPQWGASLRIAGHEVLRVAGPRGAPENPVAEDDLAAKVADLAGDRLDGVLEDPQRPAAEVLAAAGLAGA
jgi:2-methylcitrate dehydratase PrpD